MPSVAASGSHRQATVERGGVVYARVYDLRGSPTPQLLTMPPP